MKNFIKDFGIYVIIFALVLICVSFTQNATDNAKVEKKNYNDLITALDEGIVSKLQIENSENGVNVKVTAYIKNEEVQNETAAENTDTQINVDVNIPEDLNNPNDKEITANDVANAVLNKVQDTLKKQNIKDKIVAIVPSMSSFQEKVNEVLKVHPEMIVETTIKENYDWVFNLIPMLITIALAIFLFSILMGQMGGSGGGKMNSFGKSKARMYKDDLKDITFKKVAGLIEEKEELTEIVEFLKNPKKFIDMGARIPKGVLLVGPPGTGKTLLGKAVAGEAGVPFFSISGSDFVEMFVGVGASRVRDLFEEAKKNSPCIVFIDEIDAVGRKRGAGLGGGHDEREQTLNQLLVEMDGFQANQGVIVLAATNRADILDTALTRPGRFDRTVYVGKPDVKGREQILRVHAANKPIANSVNFETIAKTTAGFTGADLENLMNESAIIAAKREKKEIDMKDIGKAFVKVGIGTEKKSKIISEKEKRMTAYHEGGHAILHYVLSEIDNVHSISIIPTGFAGGYTMPLPSEDRQTLTKKYMEQEICALLGGRIAESLKMGDITTGASNDIERATAIAREMVTKYGMSDRLGPVNYDTEDNEVFIGRDLGKTKNYGEDIARVIDEEVRRIIEEQYIIAEKILKENDAILERVRKELVDREKLTGDEFDMIMKGLDLPEKIIEIDDEVKEDDLDVFNPDKQISLDDVETERVKKEFEEESEKIKKEWEEINKQMHEDNKNNDNKGE
ncbi:MAG: ATP-dependent zinc metalloprotease FtsH [Clostridia bacterium]|nr:ATP-dependent zinc metalloprotease FtsH [Clostridia bacterium]